MIIQLIQSIFLKFGVEIKKYRPGDSYWASLVRMLAHQNIDLVLDIGANTGQFAVKLRSHGYKGKIVSFEPLRSAYDQLLLQASGDPLWTVAPRMAIGDIDGEIEINISANSVSSSIAGMLEAHIEAAPEASYVGRELVSISRLDTIADEYIPETSRAFMKIDTQGYEMQVLSGAQNVIHRLAGMQIELSLVPLYEGGGMFIDMVRKIGDLGFELHGVFDSFTNPQSGRMLQVDGVFFRPIDKK